MYSPQKRVHSIVMPGAKPCSACVHNQKKKNWINRYCRHVKVCNNVNVGGYYSQQVVFRLVVEFVLKQGFPEVWISMKSADSTLNPQIQVKSG